MWKFCGYTTRDTLLAWRERLLANTSRVIELFDERFLRMWEFYLCATEAGFRIDRMFVFQLQLTRHLETRELTRSYLATAEAALRKREKLTSAYAAHAV